MFQIRLVFIIIILLLSASIALCEDMPYSTRFVIYNAQKLMEKGKYDQAIKLLKDFKKKRGNFSKHYLIEFTLGNCFFMKRDFKDAKKYYFLCLKKKPDFSSAWLNLAQCLYALKEYRGASDSFLKAYKVASKKDPDYIYWAGICLLNSGRYNDAILILKRLLKLSLKPKIEWEEAIAYAYISCRDYKNALPFVTALSENIKIRYRKKWQKLRVQIYLILNMKKEAILYLKRLIKEDPIDSVWWKALAHVYLEEDDYKDALCALIIKGYLKNLTKQEKKIMAQLSLVIGIPKEALKFYKELVQKEPSSDLFYYIAQSYLRIHKTADALLYINKALKLSPKDKRLILLKAEILYQLEMYKDAAIVFFDAAKKGIFPGRSWLMAGYAFINAGDMKRAYYALLQAKKYPKQKVFALKLLHAKFRIPAQ